MISISKSISKTAYNILRKANASSTLSARGSICNSSLMFQKDYYQSLYYTGYETFAKITKKKQEKLDHQKERQETEVPKTIDLDVHEDSFKKLLEAFKVSYTIFIL